MWKKSISRITSRCIGPSFTFCSFYVCTITDQVETDIDIPLQTRHSERSQKTVRSNETGEFIVPILYNCCCIQKNVRSPQTRTLMLFYKLVCKNPQVCYCLFTRIVNIGDKVVCTCMETNFLPSNMWQHWHLCDPPRHTSFDEWPYLCVHLNVWRDWRRENDVPGAEIARSARPARTLSGNAFDASLEIIIWSKMDKKKQNENN